MNFIRLSCNQHLNYHKVKPTMSSIPDQPQPKNIPDSFQKFLSTISETYDLDQETEALFVEAYRLGQRYMISSITELTDEFKNQIAIKSSKLELLSKRKYTTTKKKKSNTNTQHIPSKCPGCSEDQPNQVAHMGVGGCLEDTTLDSDPSSDKPIKISRKEHTRIIISPVRKYYNSKGPCSRLEWDKQEYNESMGKQMFWNDSKYNTAEPGDLLCIWHQNSHVSFHMITQILEPNQNIYILNRHRSQKNLNVLMITCAFKYLDWDNWINIGGWKRVANSCEIKTAKPAILKEIGYE